MIEFLKGIVWRCLRGNAIQHRDPDDSPTEDTQDGGQI